MDKRIKHGVSLKALDAAGHGTARIAVMSAVDSDGDTYAPGAFAWKEGGEQWVQILPAHDRQALPLGKARVYEEGDEVLAELHLNLETAAGRDWHASLKFDLEGCCEGAPGIQEWSYGFQVLEAEAGTRAGERVNVLRKLDVYEISPVVRGAGVGTGTLAMKQEGAMKSADREQLAAVKAEIAADVKAAEAGTLSTERLVELRQVKTEMGEVMKAIDAAIDAAEAPARIARQQAARFQATLAGIE